MNTQQERFTYYFEDRNGLWKERLDEWDAKGKSSSSIARLIHACEIGDGIDQHASEDLKAVSAFTMAQADTIAALVVERDEYKRQAKLYNDDMLKVREQRDALKKLIPFVLRHYDDTDDEFTESFHVDENYKIVDPSKTDEWKAVLTLKQIAKRRLEKFAAALAKGDK